MVVSTNNFRIEGLTELMTLFQNLQPSMTTSFHEITGRYGQSMLRDMYSRCPVRTGYLRSTIGLTSSPNSFQIYVGADYASFVNFGTRYMKARPFFTGPIEEQSPQMVQEYNNAVASALGGSRSGI